MRIVINIDEKHFRMVKDGLAYKSNQILSDAFKAATVLPENPEKITIKPSKDKAYLCPNTDCISNKDMVCQYPSLIKMETINKTDGSRVLLCDMYVVKSPCGQSTLCKK